METTIINTEIKVLQKTTILGKEVTVYGTLENPLFLAKDVAEWIEHKNITDLTNLVDEDEKHLTSIMSNSGQKRKMWFLTEDGIYEILMQSRKPIAKQFKKAVKKILKELRLKGGYIATKENDTPEIIMARALQVAQQTIDNHEQRVKMLEGCVELQSAEMKKQAPKVEYYDEVLTSTSTYNTKHIAKELGMSAIALNRTLHSLGIQYKHRGTWLLYSKYQNKGYSKTETHTYTNSKGETQTSIQAVWTEKGREFIHELLKQQNVA